MFQLIDNTTADLNGKRLRVSGIDDAGNRVPSAVDATTGSTTRYGNHVEVRELAGVKPNQFPEDFYFSISGVRGQFRRLSDVTFNRSGASATIDYSFDFSYSEWEHAIPLSEFVDLFEAVLCAEVAGAQSTGRSESDGYIYVTLTVEQSLDSLCAAEFGKIDRAVSEHYRKSIAATRTTTNLTPSVASGEPGYKWWLRYVIVPILCSGALAGVLLWYLKQP